MGGSSIIRRRFCFSRPAAWPLPMPRPATDHGSLPLAFARYALTWPHSSLELRASLNSDGLQRAAASGAATSFSVGRPPAKAGAIGLVCVHFCSLFQNKTQPGRRIVSEANGSRQWPQARPPRPEGDRQRFPTTRFRTPSTQHGCRTQPPTRRRIGRQRASPPYDRSSPFSPSR